MKVDYYHFISFTIIQKILKTMKKQYITPVVEQFEVARNATLLLGSRVTNNKWALGVNEADDESSRWPLNGDIREYTGDGSDIVVSGRGTDVWSDWE